MNIKQHKYDIAYLKMALEWGKLSHCKRKQVGALIVKDRMIISDGFNGTPSGFDNNCEYDTYKDGLPILVTKPEVLHAESNALMKLCKSTNSSLGSTIYLTHSPCFDCSKLILQSGIIRVVYNTEYRTNDGINFLKQSDITVDQINI